MIKIKSEIVKTVRCEHCNTEFEYEDSDVHPIYQGRGFTCPTCGNDVVVEHFDTTKPIYPKNFYRFNGKEMSDEIIQEWCERIMTRLKDEEPGEFASIASGNAIAIGMKYEDETDILVAKDYELFEKYDEMFS